MFAKVHTDVSIRTIVVKIEGADERHTLDDVNATWRAKPRPFRPDNLRIVIEGGAFKSVTVSGQLVLKTGKVSDNHSSRDSVTWSCDRFMRAKFEDAPDWVRTIVNEAQGDTTSWGFLSPDEVVEL